MTKQSSAQSSGINISKYETNPYPPQDSSQRKQSVNNGTGGKTKGTLRKSVNSSYGTAQTPTMHKPRKAPLVASDRKNKINYNSSKTRLGQNTTPKQVSSTQKQQRSSLSNYPPTPTSESKLIESLKQNITLTNHIIMEQFDIKPEDVKTQMLIQKWLREQTEMQVKIRLSIQNQSVIFHKNLEQHFRAFILMQERHYQLLISHNMDLPYVYVQTLKSSIQEAQKKMLQFTFTQDQYDKTESTTSGIKPYVSSGNNGVTNKQSMVLNKNIRNVQRTNSTKEMQPNKQLRSPPNQSSEGDRARAFKLGRMQLTAKQSNVKIDLQQQSEELYNISLPDSEQQIVQSAYGQFFSYNMDLSPISEEDRRVMKPPNFNCNQQIRIQKPLNSDLKANKHVNTQPNQKQRRLGQLQIDNFYDIQSDDEENKMEIINSGFVAAAGSPSSNIKSLNSLQPKFNKKMQSGHQSQPQLGYQMNKLKSQQKKLESHHTMEFNFVQEETEESPSEKRVMDHVSIKSIERKSCGNSMKQYLNFQSNFNKENNTNVDSFSTQLNQIQLINQRNLAVSVQNPMLTNHSGTPSYISQSNTKQLTLQKDNNNIQNSTPQQKEQIQPLPNKIYKVLKTQRTPQQSNFDLVQIQQKGIQKQVNKYTNQHNSTVSDQNQNSNQNFVMAHQLSNFFQKSRMQQQDSNKKQKQTLNTASFEFIQNSDAINQIFAAKGDIEFEVPDEETKINIIEKSVDRLSILSGERQKQFKQIQNTGNSIMPFSPANYKKNDDFMSEKAASNNNVIMNSPSCQSIASMNMRSITSLNNKQRSYQMTRSIQPENARRFDKRNFMNSFNLQQTNQKINESQKIESKPAKQFYFPVNHPRISSPLVESSQMTKIKHIFQVKEKYPTIKEQIKKQRMAQQILVKKSQQFSVVKNNTKNDEILKVRSAINVVDNSQDSLMSFSNFSDTNEHIGRIHLGTPDVQTSKGFQTNQGIVISNSQQQSMTICNQNTNYVKNDSIGSSSMTNTVSINKSGVQLNNTRPNIPVLMAPNLKKSNTQLNMQSLQTPRNVISIKQNAFHDRQAALSSPTKSNSLSKYGGDKNYNIQSINLNKKSMHTENNKQKVVRGQQVKTLPQSFAQSNNNIKVGLALEIKACSCNYKQYQKMYNNNNLQDQVSSPRSNFRNKFNYKTLSEHNDTPFILNSPIIKNDKMERPLSMMKSFEMVVRASEPTNFKQKLYLHDSGTDDQQCCGNYCRNLPSEKQKEIILNCFKTNLNYQVRDKMQFMRKSLNSLNPQISQQLLQKNLDSSLKIKRDSSKAQLMMHENDSRYLIASAWWQEWCDYANFDMNQLIEDAQNEISQQQPTVQLPHVRDNQQQVRGRRRDSVHHQKEERITSTQLEDDFKKELQYIKRQKSLERTKINVESFKSTDIHRQASVETLNKTKFPFKESQNGSMKVEEEYKKPGKIRNQPLLPDSNMYQPNHMKNLYISIKQNLIEHFDYEVVPADIWAYFKSWYDYDFAILRYVKRDNMNTDKLYLELYPEQKMSGEVNGLEMEKNKPKSKVSINQFGIIETSFENHDALSSDRDHWKILTDRTEDKPKKIVEPVNHFNSKQQIIPKQSYNHQKLKTSKFSKLFQNN